MLAQCTWQSCRAVKPHTDLQHFSIGECTWGRPQRCCKRASTAPPCPAAAAVAAWCQRPRCRRSRCCISAAAASSEAYEFVYEGSDGRKKATFEQAFKHLGGSNVSGSGGTQAAAGGSSAAPWALGYQMAEKYTLWNDDFKARMLKRVAADELSIDEGELELRLQRVQLLLPDIQHKLPSMKARVVARLAAEVERLPGRLLRLKAIFPGANTSLLAMRQPELVLGFDLDRVEAVAEELRQMLPALDIDRLVAENPAMLDVPGLKKAMAEAQRIMPQLDVQKAMATDPQLIFSFQTGNQLIPYDQFSPDSKTGEGDDDEYATYYN